jgi:hypothetical protein
MPSDVRRGYAAPFNLELGDGLRPRFGLARISLAKGRTKGKGQALRSMEPLTARQSRFQRDIRRQPFQRDIRRQSRFQRVKYTFRAKPLSQLKISPRGNMKKRSATSPYSI